jgi:hypothetical protein
MDKDNKCPFMGAEKQNKSNVSAINVNMNRLSVRSTLSLSLRAFKSSVVILPRLDEKSITYDIVGIQRVNWLSKGKNG